MDARPFKISVRLNVQPDKGTPRSGAGSAPAMAACRENLRHPSRQRWRWDNPALPFPEFPWPAVTPGDRPLRPCRPPRCRPGVVAAWS